MRKKFIAVFAVLLLALSTFFACSGDHYKSVSITGIQDYTYTVESNGGSAVRYGNYIYFINGTRGYDDSDGTANIFGDVVKGALYRAELSGEKDGSVFKTEIDQNTGLKLVSYKDKDYKRDETDVVNVECIVPKTIGTSAYSDGGIYIFDDYVYYASPNNLKDKTGEVKYNLTDFFRSKLDGSDTQKIYTSENETEDKPYTFMSYGDSVYLVVLDDTDLISIKIDKSSGKTQKTLLAEDVSNAVLPTKTVYYKGITNNSIYDFVYYEKDATTEDVPSSGERIELCRPDGSDSATLASGISKDYTLVTVKDGLLFYKDGDGNLIATNLYDSLCKASEDFANAEAENKTDSNYTETILTGASDLTVYPYASAYEYGEANASNIINILVIQTTTSSSSSSSSSDSSTSTSALSLYNNVNVDVKIKEIVSSASSITVQGAYKTTFCYVADGTLYSVSTAPGSDYSALSISSAFTSSGLKSDFAGDYLIYLANIDDDATGYAFFYDLYAGDNSKSIFVGERTEDEQPSVIESISIEMEPTKIEYKQGEDIDLDGLKVTATYYADSEGNRLDENGNSLEDVEVEIDEDMISGFDSSTAGEQTVTITYDGKTATFTVTITDEQSGLATWAYWVIGISCAVVVAGVSIFLVIYFRKRKIRILKEKAIEQKKKKVASSANKRVLYTEMPKDGEQSDISENANAENQNNAEQPEESAQEPEDLAKDSTKADVKPENADEKDETK